MTVATKEFLASIDALSEKKKNEILTTEDCLTLEGSIIYLSEKGDDSNDGKSKETPIRTIEALNKIDLEKGDAVLFERGGVFRGQVLTKAGVTYGAYGQGPKPKIYGYEENLAGKEKWELVNAERNIWKFYKKTPDSGTLVFNDGEKHSIKLIPSFSRSGKFVLREDTGTEFDINLHMENNLDLFCNIREALSEVPADRTDIFPVPIVTGTTGDLYLKCDGGNPGEIFRSIELLPKRNTFEIKNNRDVHIDNLCIKYCGAHGVGAVGQVDGLTVTNCEIGWIGGCIQGYSGSSAERCGTVTRYGNGVEIYGGCEKFVVDNCYIYQVYDAAITPQMECHYKWNTIMRDMYFTNNLIEDCVYSIEYFMGRIKGTVSYIENFEISNNIMRRSGYGFGSQRYNKDTPNHIMGWGWENPAKDFRIVNNIFDTAAYKLLFIACSLPQSLPTMSGNTYIQHENGLLGRFGANGLGGDETHVYDTDCESVIMDIFGDKEAKVYIIKS
ncbi:MAG: hypothetical protein IKU43_06030 [Clostridia bacterium]|nr:hypothetical protein [Clostridia bacterium]